MFPESKNGKNKLTATKLAYIIQNAQHVTL